MSLPPGFLDELRNRVSISQVVGRKVVWDMRKSNQAKGDWWAPCPFHQEKSASFHVDDRKGYYYCFGCHAKGDALTFLRESENMGFMEAVELLAREAGLQMPARDPVAAQKADQRTELARVMEEAVRHYRLQFSMQSGQIARDYVARRGLTQETLERFEIGWAPDQRQGLYNALVAKGIAPDLIVEAGLCARPEDGGAPYDRFRGRVIFPIRDARGRAISLGGRSLDPNARAKYLNGPETLLFDKGRNLYNHGPAREACGKGQRLVVCEGYMDVIALAQAGFMGAVAPLGTAVTEEQLHLMWRIHDEPVISLDGDTAGMRAALRVIDLALPLLEAGKGLRFAILPGGQDPDELIKASGREAMETVLANARPMVDLLWSRETEGQVFDSPERRAALDKRLRQAIARIQDPSLKRHYGAEINRLREELFGYGRSDKGSFAAGGGGAKALRGGAARAGTGFAPKGFGSGKRGFAATGPMVQPSTLTSALAVTRSTEAAEHLREALILAVLATHPQLVAEFEGQLERLHFSDPSYERICGLMLSCVGGAGEEIAARLKADLGSDLEKLMAQPHVRSALAMQMGSDADYAAHCLASDLAKLIAFRAWKREIADAREELPGLADEGLTWRLAQAAKAVDEALKPVESDDRATVRADNGVELDREELEQSRAILDAIDFSRGGRGTRRE